DFMKFNSDYYWTGATYSAGRRAWVWRDGSAVSQETFPIDPKTKKDNCITYSPEKQVSDSLCGTQLQYICKKKLI
ncbi:Natural killer cells antigen CD94, partial [Galemys pyrenaicus]